MDKRKKGAQTKTFSFSQFGRLRSRKSQHFQLPVLRNDADHLRRDEETGNDYED